MTAVDEWAQTEGNPMFDPFAPEKPAGPLCERDGIEYDTYGGEREWQCGYPGTVRVPSGRLFCEDHAGELGYGPKQEEYGFDPNDGLNPTPGCLHAAVVVYRDRKVWYPCRSHEGGVHHFAARWPSCPTAWCRLPPEQGHLHDIPSGTVEYHDVIGADCG